MAIKVLHVIDHLGYGGAPTVVKNIVERMDRRRVENIVCALRKNPRSLPIEATVINLKCRKYNPFAAIGIALVRKKENIDIVHAHLPKSVMSCLLARFLVDVPVIIHLHGAILKSGSGALFPFLLRILGRRAIAAVANSQATRAALEKTGFPSASIRVISNFVDVNRFDPNCYDRDEARKALGTDRGDIVIGFVGRLDYDKGADLLVQAARILAKANRRYRVVIVGDGAERKRLESLIAQRDVGGIVTLAGLCKNPAEMIAGFDMAVIPSRREAFGIAAVEFMLMRVPIVVSPVGGLVEIVTDGQTGLILDQLSPECIAEAVDRLAGDSDLRRRLADKAAPFAMQFDGRLQVRQLEQLYEEVCPPRQHKSQNP
jgi:glycosyltransferase involved in cell wall biosynthesis